MFKKLALAAIIATTAVVSGCSREVVGPGELGKVLSTSGYSADLKQTGKYWLWITENMVVLDMTTQTLSEKISIKMADDLQLDLQIRARVRIRNDERIINAMFNDIRHQQYRVNLPMVYHVYGRDEVTNAARSIISKYKIAEISNNFDRINQELQVELSKRMRNSPIELSNVTIGELVYPAIITKAIEDQMERELAIQTEKNNQAILMEKKANMVELEQKNYEIEMIKARAIRDYNKITADGLNPLLIQYRQLEVMEKMAENQNAVFVPYESLNNTGLQNRMYNK